MASKYLWFCYGTYLSHSLGYTKNWRFITILKQKFCIANSKEKTLVSKGFPALIVFQNLFQFFCWTFVKKLLGEIFFILITECVTDPRSPSEFFFFSSWKTNVSQTREIPANPSRNISLKNKFVTNPWNPRERFLGKDEYVIDPLPPLTPPRNISLKKWMCHRPHEPLPPPQHISLKIWMYGLQAGAPEGASQ